MDRLQWGILAVLLVVLAFTVPSVVLDPHTDWEVAGPVLGGSLVTVMAALLVRWLKRRRA